MPGEAETVRGAFESMAQGLEQDEEGRAHLAERWWHPQIEYVEDASWPGSQAYRGRDAVLQAFEGYREVLGGAVVVEEVREGTNGVFARIRYSGTSTGAEMPWEQSWGYHCRVRDGRLGYFRAYSDIEQAKRDAGVS